MLFRSGVLKPLGAGDLFKEKFAKQFKELADLFEKFKDRLRQMVVGGGHISNTDQTVFNNFTKQSDILLHKSLLSQKEYSADQNLGDTYQNLKNRFRNKWIQNKEDNESGIGGILGRSANPSIRGIGNLMSNWKSSLVIVTTAMLALHKAIRLLQEGVQHGAETYRNAARMGTAIGDNFAITSAFKAIGMESPDLSRLQGQFNQRANKFDAPGTDVILGAAKAGQFGNMQQLLNMSVEFKAAMADAVANGRQMAAIAQPLNQLSISTSELGREWKTLESQLADLFEPVLYAVVESLKFLISSLNWAAEKLIHLGGNIAYLLPGGTVLGPLFGSLTPRGSGGDFHQIGGGRGSAAGANAWEKMGFVMNGPSTNYQAQIADRTNTMSKTLKDVLKVLTTIESHNAGDLGGNSIPSIP